MNHPVHQLFETTLATAPLILLGLPTDVAVALVFCVGIQLLVQYSNVDYAVGPLRRLLAVNQLHRFHHLRWSVVGDVNFGLFTNVWDHLLGTYVWDPGRRFASADIGVDAEPDFPERYGCQRSSWSLVHECMVVAVKIVAVTTTSPSWANDTFSGSIAHSVGATAGYHAPAPATTRT